MTMSSSDSTSHSVPAWAERYADFVIKFRWPLMLLLLIATVVAALQIKNLDMRNDPDTLLPPTNRYVATNLYAEHNFGMGNLMVFTLRIKEGDVYQGWFINKVQEIHKRLVELPEARESNFIDIAAKKIKYMGADENGLVFKRLIPTEGISDDPAVADEQLAFLKEGVEGNPVIGPMLVGFEDAQGNKCEFNDKDTKNCTAKSLYIIGDYTDDVKAIYLPWVREIRAMMDEYSEDDRFETLVAGEPYFLAWMLADLVNNLSVQFNFSSYLIQIRIFSAMPQMRIFNCQFLLGCNQADRIYIKRLFCFCYNFAGCIRNRYFYGRLFLLTVFIFKFSFHYD
jgi:predicted RND superfamily exporter protein